MFSINPILFIGLVSSSCAYFAISKNSTQHKYTFCRYSPYYVYIFFSMSIKFIFCSFLFFLFILIYLLHYCQDTVLCFVNNKNITKTRQEDKINIHTNIQFLFIILIGRKCKVTECQMMMFYKKIQVYMKCIVRKNDRFPL